jgi:UDP-3-O-[3-hydroxymyristoyl] N-acetylglucosamine deacetylase
LPIKVTRPAHAVGWIRPDRLARKANTVRVIAYRYQRTLAESATVAGVGFVTGARVVVRFHPAPPGAGLSFRRVDLPGTPSVPARVEAVTGTQRRTTLGSQEHGVTLVEHVLAALAGLRVDNCVVDLDGPEPPGLDGSARGFVDVLTAAGITNQSARRPIYATSEPVVIRVPGATLALHPATRPGLRVSYRLDYGPAAPIPPQTHTNYACPAAFVRDLASCRTFLTEAEAADLRAQGLGRHLTAANLLVFGRHGPIDNRTRFADEPARHKILDLIGDLALCGFDLAGHVVAYRSGHAMNVELARALAAASGRKSVSRKVVTAVRQAA